MVRCKLAFCVFGYMPFTHVVVAVAVISVTPSTAVRGLPILSHLSVTFRIHPRACLSSIYPSGFPGIPASFTPGGIAVEKSKFVLVTAS